MDWSKGYVSSCYATYVDPVTWGDTERFDIISGSVSRTSTELRQSAELECPTYEMNTERWIRVYLDARQNDEVTHVPLFTGLATSPTVDINGVVTSQKVKCYSVLKPAQDILLPLGWYVPVGANGVEMIRNLLNTLKAPIDPVGEAPIITRNIIAEGNETRLTMVSKVLDAMGWMMRITGDGTIQLLEPPKDVSIICDPAENDIVEPSLSISNDWFECPNVYRATMDDVSATVKDDDAIARRGREVWLENDVSALAEGMSLAEYARRALENAQKVEETASYTRRFEPATNVGDIVRMRYEQINGDFRITSQKFSLGLGQAIAEEVERL